MSLVSRSDTSSLYRREPSIIRSVSIRTWDDAKTILLEEPPEMANPCLAIPKNCQFIYQEAGDSYGQHIRLCPRVTLNLFQQGLEPTEFNTELGEPQKKNLPSYYYQASQTVRGRARTGNSRRSGSAKRPETALVTSRRAFASPINNEPVYYPELERSGRFPGFMTPTSITRHKVFSASEIQINITDD